VRLVVWIAMAPQTWVSGVKPEMSVTAADWMVSVPTTAQPAAA